MRLRADKTTRHLRGTPGATVLALIVIIGLACVLGVAGVTDTGGTTANGSRSVSRLNQPRHAEHRRTHASGEAASTRQPVTSLRTVSTPAGMAYISQAAARKATTP